MRIGQGYDVHKLVKDRDLILCGVKIPHDKGLDGHSDADVATHALSDAILGAMAMGDIGTHFPDNDPQYKNISSILLLSHIIKKVHDAGYRIHNADITIIAQKPKLLPYREEMRKNIADTLCVSIDAINVKSTTTENLGFEGRLEGISSMAVCLLEKA